MNVGESMRIEIVFDTVCPWCFIGKRRLEKALASRPKLRARIIWRPFLLNPDMPIGGIDRRLYLERKFGSPHRIQRILNTIANAGAPDGIDFKFERMRRTPSSLQSHRLVRLADHYGIQTAMVERLFQAFFLEGRDIGSVPELAELGVEAGLPPGEVVRFLQGEEEMASVLQENSRAHRRGMSGVPSFVINGRFAIAGAQEADVIARLLDLGSADSVQDEPVSHEMALA